MRISVLMTVYNTQAYLAEAVESVLNQSFTDFEFIIIDDGSKDGSLALLEKYARQDSRIRLFSQPNAGCSQAGNRGFSLATCDWVFRFDSDDVMYPGRLERQVAFIEGHPGVKAVSCQVDFIDEFGRKIMRSQQNLLTPADWQQYYDHCRPVVIPHTGAALHRQTVLDVGGYDHDYFSDTYLFSRMIEAGHLILMQPAVLGAYRVHSGSIMSRNVFWGEIGSEWIHDNWLRRRNGESEIDWETYKERWRGWSLFPRLNRFRLVRARLHAREIVRLLKSKNRLKLGLNLVGLCLIAPDYLLSRAVRRYKFS